MSIIMQIFYTQPGKPVIFSMNKHLRVKTWKTCRNVSGFLVLRLRLKFKGQALKDCNHTLFSH